MSVSRGRRSAVDMTHKQVRMRVLKRRAHKRHPGPRNYELAPAHEYPTHNGAPRSRAVESVLHTHANTPSAGEVIVSAARRARL